MVTEREWGGILLGPESEFEGKTGRSWHLDVLPQALLVFCQDLSSLFITLIILYFYGFPLEPWFRCSLDVAVGEFRLLGWDSFTCGYRCAIALESFGELLSNLCFFIEVLPHAFSKASGHISAGLLLVATCYTIVLFTTLCSMASWVLQPDDV